LIRSIEGLVTFVKAAVKNPFQVSTVFPSSRFLANAMLDAVNIEGCERIVEIGVGTGALTRPLFQRISSTAHYSGFEVDEGMVRYMQKEFPDREFLVESAENLIQFVPENSVDALVSGLPWSVFPEPLQEKLIQQIHSVLKPDGRFVTFMYPNASVYPAAKRVLKRFDETFDDFGRKSLVFANIPPAHVLCGKKSTQH